MLLTDSRIFLISGKNLRQEVCSRRNLLGGLGQLSNFFRDFVGLWGELAPKPSYVRASPPEVLN